MGMWASMWLALSSFCLVAAHVAEAKTNGHAAWLPSLRLIFKHSDVALKGEVPVDKRHGLDETATLRL